MQEVRQSVESVADASVPVLLLGDQGTGKEVIAREIHRRSPWQSAPFVKMYGSEKLDNLLQNPASERGGPADSSSRRILSVLQGTLFIDEVSELTPARQAKLLEFFQEDSSGRMNRESSNAKNARVICATKQNLENHIATGKFRLDLFYRINVVTIKLPRLCDRREDILELAEYFFAASCRQDDRPCPGLPAHLLQLFSEYDWPDNIRELENCVRTYVNMGGDATATEALLWKGPAAARTKSKERPKIPMPLKAYTRQLVEQAEKDMIHRVLREQRWNRKETARVLQVSYQTLLHKLKQTGLDKKYKPGNLRAEKATVERLP